MSLTKKKYMRAYYCKSYGPPEVLELRTVETPEPKPNEFLVKIKATAINSGDVRVRGLVVKGILKVIMRIVLGIRKPRNPILGTVLSGEIVQIGSEIRRFKVGDEVFAMTGFKFGTFAEYILLTEKSVVAKKPKSASHAEAAALIFGGSTAIHFLDKSKIEALAKPKVLIYGASGSVGTSAVQIAKNYGAQVHAICSAKNHDLILKLGAEKVMNYDNSEWMNNSEQYDLIFDAVGKIKYPQCKSMLKAKGKFLTVGGLDVASEKVAQLELLTKLFESEKLDAVIDKIYTFEQMIEAHKYVDSGRKKGNVVVEID